MRLGTHARLSSPRLPGGIPPRRDQESRRPWRGLCLRPDPAASTGPPHRGTQRARPRRDGATRRPLPGRGVETSPTSPAAIRRATGKSGGSRHRQGGDLGRKSSTTAVAIGIRPSADPQGLSSGTRKLATKDIRPLRGAACVNILPLPLQVRSEARDEDPYTPERHIWREPADRVDEREGHRPPKNVTRDGSTWWTSVYAYRAGAVERDPPAKLLKPWGSDTSLGNDVCLRPPQPRIQAPRAHVPISRERAPRLPKRTKELKPDPGAERRRRVPGSSQHLDLDSREKSWSRSGGTCGNEP